MKQWLLVLWLSALATPLHAQESWRRLEHRGDQRYRLYTKDSQLRLEGHWSREIDWRGEIPYVLSDGYVLIRGVNNQRFLSLIDTDGKECWRLSKASSTMPELFIQDSLEVLWLTSDQRRAWIHLDRSLAVVDLATGLALSAPELIAKELDQGAGDVSCLLRAAYRLRLTPPPSLLHRADPPGKFLQLGWRARLGEAKALASLQLAVRRGETGALEGLAVLGPQTVRAALVNDMLNGQGWLPALTLLDRRGDDILCEALARAPLPSTASVQLVEMAVNKDERFWAPLLRLSQSSSPAAELAMQNLLTVQVQDLDRRLLALLDHGSVLEYFLSHPCRQVSAPLVAKLKADPDSEQNDNILEVLQYQNRVDFGRDPAAWERWLANGAGQPAAVKASLLEELKEPTALLWQAQISRLEPARLQSLPRLQAMWPVPAALSVEGHLLLATGGASGGEDKAWDSATGRPLSKDRLLSPNGRFHLRHDSVLDVRSGRSLPLPDGADPAGCSNHALLVQRTDPATQESLVTSVLDLERFTLFGLPHLEQPCLSPTRSEVVALTPNFPELVLFDWRRKRAVMRLKQGWTPVEIAFSRDGEWILLSDENRWQILDRTGKQLFTARRGKKSSTLVLDFEHRTATLSPDKTQLATLDPGRLRLTSLAHPQQQRERPWMALGVPVFFPDSRSLLLRSGLHRLSLLDSADLYERTCFWGPEEHLSVRRDGLQFSATGSDSDSTWIWQMSGMVPSVPDEKQVLLCELWTGMHLRGGTAVPLSPTQYLERVRRWQQDGGGSWYAGPTDLPHSNSAWWLTLASALAVGGLATAGGLLLANSRRI